MKNKIKENDLFIFFEVIEQLEPQTVLDIGPLLKKAGSVSRKAMNRKISEEIRMDGVDFTPESNFLTLKNIYDEIINFQDLYKQMLTVKYDCVILIGCKEELKMKDQLPDLFHKIQDHSTYLLTDHLFKDQTKKNCKVTDLRVENDLYYLYNFGDIQC